MFTVLLEGGGNSTNCFPIVSKVFFNNSQHSSVHYLLDTASLLLAESPIPYRWTHHCHQMQWCLCPLDTVTQPTKQNYSCPIWPRHWEKQTFLSWAFLVHYWNALMPHFGVASVFFTVWPDKLEVCLSVFRFDKMEMESQIEWSMLAQK